MQYQPWLLEQATQAQIKRADEPTPPEATVKDLKNADCGADGISGFLKRSDSLYTYDCSEELHQKVDRLAETYRLFLIPVTNLIHAKPRNIRQFSDAFKFRTDG